MIASSLILWLTHSAVFALGWVVAAGLIRASALHGCSEDLVPRAWYDQLRIAINDYFAAPKGSPEQIHAIERLDAAIRVGQPEDMEAAE